MKEFFGFGGYQRTPEGYMSWQHLTFVTSLMVIMVVMACLLGRKNRNSSEKSKNKVLIWAAILIDSFELFKIVLMCVRGHDPMGWVTELPLFLCSIQLIAIPMAAFCKGRLREASLDFVMIFGILGAVMGTYAAGQNYACYPVLSFDNEGVRYYPQHLRLQLPVHPLLWPYQHEEEKHGHLLLHPAGLLRDGLCSQPPD